MISLHPSRRTSVIASLLIAVAPLAACSGEEGEGGEGPVNGNEQTPREVTTTEGSNVGPVSEPPVPVLTTAVDAQAPSQNKPFDMRTWRPDAKGLWIWYLDYIGMNAAQAAAKAQSLGVGYVLIKSGQDKSFWSHRFNASVVKEFTSRGLRVLAWPYITPAGGAEAVDAAVQAAKVPGCDGLVLDLEIEWEKNGPHDAAAQALCSGIRAKAPGVWLGYTSFGWIGYHPALPWSTFDAHCGDAYFPQVYFSDRGVAWDGAKGLSQSLAQYKAANLKAPLWPIGSNDDVHGTTAGPSTTALNGFMNAAGPYTSLYAFPDPSRTAEVAQLSLLDWKN